ncbi:MAG: hypothetical protein HY670_06920 [Chloroflexi bacterium]|nr:hypothetical protein [Chloroflexota bacterium]
MDDDRIMEAVKHTEILRLPKQSLATFGTTNVYYYLLTEPSYTELVGKVDEVVIREGRVIAERPKVVTPYYLTNMEGFSPDARRYLDMLVRMHGTSVPGVLYSYRNEPKELNIVSDTMESVVDRLNADIERRGDPLACIIKGEDELWDVSLMKFIFELTRGSLYENLWQMSARGLLEIDTHGIPRDARLRIDQLFARAERGDCEPRVLKEELDRWNVFEEYQDRFFRIFKKK